MLGKRRAAGCVGGKVVELQKRKSSRPQTRCSNFAMSRVGRFVGRTLSFSPKNSASGPKAVYILRFPPPRKASHESPSPAPPTGCYFRVRPRIVPLDATAKFQQVLRATCVGVCVHHRHHNRRFGNVVAAKTQSQTTRLYGWRVGSFPASDKGCLGKSRCNYLHIVQKCTSRWAKSARMIFIPGRST